MRNAISVNKRYPYPPLPIAVFVLFDRNSETEFFHEIIAIDRQDRARSVTLN